MCIFKLFFTFFIFFPEPNRKLKGLRHRDLADFWHKLSWKLVVANLIHSKHFFEHLKENVILIHKEKTNHDHSYQLFEDARKQLEKFSLNFASCNLLPSSPSAVRDTC